MTEMKKINVEELVNAAGGEWRQVNRSQYNADDGRTWYELSSPDHGWMAGSILGFYD